MKALFIPALGNAKAVDLPDESSKHLTALQGFVGGWIEYVPTKQPVTLYCNEEGKIEGLPHNVTATKAFGQEIDPDYLVGDVIVLGPIDGEGENTSLDVDAWLSYVQEWSA